MRISFASLGIFLCMLASFLSYITNKSILWAIFHFSCGGFYLIYWVLFKTGFVDWVRGLVV